MYGNMCVSTLFQNIKSKAFTTEDTKDHRGIQRNTIFLGKSVFMVFLRLSSVSSVVIAFGSGLSGLGDSLKRTYLLQRWMPPSFVILSDSEESAFA